MRQRLGGLAPRRRTLVLIAVSAVVLLAAGITVAFTVGATRTVHRPAHIAAVGAPSTSAPDKPGPVILVPGYGGGRAGLLRLAAHIRATGRTAVVITLPGNGTGDLGQQAKVLQSTAARMLAGGASTVDVIGYSAGGVVARLWLADNGGAGEVRRVITLGAPLHGVNLAGVGQARAPSACPAACQQLAPGSSLLRRLDASPLGGTAWMSVWTSDDQTVVPPDSARLAGAVNVVAQGVCPNAAISHGQLPTDPLITGIVLRAIGSAPLVAPKPPDCAALRSAGAG